MVAFQLTVQLFAVLFCCNRSASRFVSSFNTPRQKIPRPFSLSDRSDTFHVTFLPLISSNYNNLKAHDRDHDSNVGEISSAEKDVIYGQILPVETKQLVSTKIQELREELDKLSAEQKENWSMAVANCPSLVDDDHKLLFLRSEQFDVNLAASRLVRYWDMRVDLFGQDKAFGSLTRTHALNDEDAVALSMGFFQIIQGVKDPEGRAILFVDPSKQDRSKYSRKSMLRAIWCQIHETLLDDEETQRNGIVFLGYPKNAKLSQWDAPLSRKIWKSLSSILPVRVVAIHFCQPASFFSIVFPIVSRLFMGKDLKERIRIHTGSDAQVLETLSSEFGMTPAVFPPNTMDVKHSK